MKNAIALLAFVAALFFIAPAQAQEDKPSKDSLLAAWEKVLKDSPYTVTFAKSEEKNAYDYETTIFPYRGKLRVLNLLIEKDSQHLYPFRIYNDDLPDGDFAGVIEVELDNTDDDFRRKFADSHHSWSRDNTLYYHAETKTWYTPAQWSAHRRLKEAAEKPAAGKECAPAEKAQESSPTLFGIFLSWLPMLILIAVWLLCMRMSGTFKYRKLIDKNMEYMDKSEVYMAKNEKLLEEILKTLKQKQ